MKALPAALYMALSLTFVFPIRGYCCRDKVSSFPALMIELGRALRPSEMIVLTSSSHPEDVSDEEWRTALAGIDQAIACSRLMLGCDLQLLPSRATEDAAFIGKLQRYATAFIHVLENYRSEFQTQSETEPERRDLSEVGRLRDKLNDVARAAHTHI